MKHIKITDKDITMGDRGCKSSCPIALALKREYNTDNVLVEIEDIPYLYVNDYELDITSKMREKVEHFIEHFDNQWEEIPEPFTLEVEGWIGHE